MFIGDLSANGKLALFVLGVGVFFGLLPGFLFAWWYERKHNRLLDAVSAIYYAAFWYPDRPVLNEITLWSTLRDAAGFSKGKAPKRLMWTSNTLGIGPYEDEVITANAPDHDAIPQPDGFSG